MAWAKLDDGMPTHPKVMAAGPMAFALDVAAICYSNKHLTDGFIATHALPAVLPGMSAPKRHADKLVEVGRWDQVDGGWKIHDFHDFQPTADHQREVSRKRAEAGSKGGRSSTSKTEATSKQNASVLLKPGPARPVPSPEQEHLAPAKPPRKPRKPDPTFDAVIEACGYNPAELTKQSRGAINAAVKQLKDVEADPDDIHRRARAFAKRWPDITLTAPALAKHWPQLAEARAGPDQRRNGQPAEVGSAAWEQQERQKKALEAAVFGESA